MARLWSSGFELNSSTTGMEFSSVTGTPVIQTGTVRSGTYASESSSLTSATARYHGIDYAASNLNGPLYFRGYLRIATMPNNTNSIMGVGNAPTHPIKIRLAADGTLTLNDEDGQIGSASSALSTGVWYRIEAMYDTTGGAGAGIAKARIDGVEFASSTTRSSGGTTLFRIGGNAFGGGAETATTGQWFWDDLAINDSTGSFQNSYPGAGAIVHLRPNAAGDNADWSPVTGPANWQDVDEVTPDDNTTRVSTTSINKVDDYNIDATPSAIGSGDTINVVQVGYRFRVSGATTPPTWVPRIKASAAGTVEEGAGIAYTSTTWVTNAIATPFIYPLTLYDLPGASTTAWTKADLDTAQIGQRISVGGTANNSQVSTAWLLVDYAAAATGDLSINVSDTITTSESVTKLVESYVNKNDTATATESVTLTSANNISVSDTITSSESSKVESNNFVNVSNTITTSESVEILATEFINVSDSATLSESVIVATVDQINKSDTITATENTKVESNNFVTVSDTITTSENISLFSPNMSITTSDTLTFTESVTLNIVSSTDRLIVVSDTLTLSESTQLLVSVNITVSDTATFTESTIPLVTSFISVSDTATFSENRNQAVIDLVSVSDTLTFTESVNRTLIDNPNVSDTLTFTESLNRLLTNNINVSDSITFTESFSANLPTLFINKSDTLTITEFVSAAGPAAPEGAIEPPSVRTPVPKRVRADTTVEIGTVNSPFEPVAQIKALYPLTKTGMVLRYSRELSDFGFCTFRVSTKDPALARLGDILQPHAYHVRIKRGGTIVWQGAIVDNPIRNRNYIEVKAAEYLYYFSKVLIRRDADNPTTADDESNFRVFATGTMSSAVQTLFSNAITDLGSSHALSAASLGTIENPNYPDNFINGNSVPLTGEWNFSSDVTVQFDYHSVLYVLKSFGIYSNSDFELTPDFVFNFKKLIGQRISGITFTYNRVGTNITDYNFPRLGQRMANDLIGIATDDSGNVLHAHKIDSASINRLGKLQDARAYTDVKNQNLLDARLKEELFLTKDPEESPITIILDEKAYPLGQFNLGDIIWVKVKDHIIDYEKERRIVGWTVNLHNTGRELTYIDTNRPRENLVGAS